MFILANLRLSGTIDKDFLEIFKPEMESGHLVASQKYTWAQCLASYFGVPGKFSMFFP